MKHSIKIKVFASVFALFVFTSLAYAQNVTMLPNPLDPNGTGTLADLLSKIITYLTMISAPIITIMILYGGFQMLIAQDNVKKFEDGIKTVKHAALGAAIVIIADGILYIVQSVLSLT